MPDPQAQASTQLNNILASTGKTVAEFTQAVRAAGLDKHGKIVAFFKETYGMTHGNANLMAHTVRQAMAGGPPPADDLLEAQYAGAKAGLKPIYERIAGLAMDLGGDVDKVIQKTGVSFRRKKQFLLVKAASAKRVELGLNLDETPAGGRVVAAKGMCTHKANITELGEVDDEVAAWLQAAYTRAG